MSEKLTNYSYDKVFKQGCAFFDVAKICEKEPDVFANTRTEFHFVAGITNSCFACELFMKTILIYNGLQEQAKGHELHELWKKIRCINFEFAKNVENKVNSLFKYNDGNSFDKMLELCNKSFIELRYIYEYKIIDFVPSFIKCLRNILHQECHKMIFS